MAEKTWTWTLRVEVTEKHVAAGFVMDQRFLDKVEALISKFSGVAEIEIMDGPSKDACHTLAWAAEEEDYRRCEAACAAAETVDPRK